jgi:hypothetical protein
MIRKRGMYAYQAMVKMSVTRPTLNKYFDKPELMDGMKRKQLASILEIEVSVIDSICNGEIKNTLKDYESVLEKIKPLKRKNNEHAD